MDIDVCATTKQREPDHLIRALGELYAREMPNKTAARSPMLHGLLLGAYGYAPRHSIELIAIDQRPLHVDQADRTKWTFIVRSYGPETTGIEIVKEDTTRIRQISWSGGMIERERPAFTRGLWVQNFQGNFAGGAVLFSLAKIREEIGGPEDFLRWLSACIAHGVNAHESRGLLKPCGRCPYQLACATKHEEVKS